MFDKATRMKLRWESSRGLLTVEDLWDLPLRATNSSPNLDRIAVELAQQLRQQGDVESFVVKSTGPDEVLQLKFDIVKHIIDIRLAEVDAAQAKADAQSRKNRLMELIARKKDQELEGKSLEELQEMVAGI